MSQDQLAVMVGATKGLISQYENGLTIPSAKRFSAIAEAVGVTVDWLLTGGEPDEQNRAQTRAEAEALAILRDIPPEHQEQARAMLAAFAASLRSGPKKV